MIIGAVATSSLVLGACSTLPDSLNPGDDTSTDAPTELPPSSPLPPVAKPIVIAVSVGGLNPDALTTLGPGAAPAFWRLINEGASTLNARTVFEDTNTLPNQASIITGRRVSGTGGTSVTFNDDNKGTLETTHGSYVPSMFDVAHDNGLRTAFFAEKSKFKFLIRSYDKKHGAVDRTGDDNGTDKLDISEIASADVLVQDVIETLQSGDAQLIFWHIAAPNERGSEKGWMSDDYLAGVREADRRLGLVLALLDAQPQIKARTTVLLTSDHGGARGVDNSADPNLLANYRVPFMAWGRGTIPHGVIYDQNPQRVDPDATRPSYKGPQPVRNFDLANSALKYLGLPNIPGSTASELNTLDFNTEIPKK